MNEKHFFGIEDQKEIKRMLRVIPDIDLTFLLEQAKKEKEHRQQVNLAQYRCEIEQLWNAFCERVKKLQELGVTITADVTTENEGDRYIYVTDMCSDDSMIVTWHAMPIYKSGD